MSAFVRVSPILEEADGRLFFHCPGCLMLHGVNIDRTQPGPGWDWNGSLDQPTFQPSILVRYPWGPDQHQVVCHSFVRDGKIEYLSDCTHHLAGKTVDIPRLEDTDDA